MHRRLCTSTASPPAFARMCRSRRRCGRESPDASLHVLHCSSTLTFPTEFTLYCFCILYFQDVWTQGNGAFTGDISADMLRDLGVRWTIVGHSERRAKVELRFSILSVAASIFFVRLNFLFTCPP